MATYPDLLCGYVYVATGDIYVKEALKSLASLKKLLPDASVCLFTDLVSNGLRNKFEHVIEISEPAHGFADKVRILKESPFDRTLFIDTDTYFIDDPSILFQLLDRFDLGYCHSTYRFSKGEEFKGSIVPNCFVEANTGVILYRRNTTTNMFFDLWLTLFQAHTEEYGSPNPPDQPTFREAVYLSSGLQTTVFPMEYNFRTTTKGLAGSYLPVSILHGRDPSLDIAVNQLSQRNQSSRLNQIVHTHFPLLTYLFSPFSRRTMQRVIDTLTGKFR